MADGTRTGVKLDYIAQAFNFADFNDLVKYVDNGVGRVLVQHTMADGLLTAAVNPLLVNTTTKRFTAPTGSAVVAGLVQGRAFYMDATHESGGTVVNGATTYIEDSGLVNADDFWNGAYVVFTSGTYDGQVKLVSDFVNAYGRLVWASPLGGAPAPGDTYVVTFFYIPGLTNGSINYIYGTVGTRTPNEQIIDWSANTTGTKPAASIYVSTMTLSAGGVVTASSNNPTDADRVAYKNVGAHNVITLTGSVTGLAAGGTVEITREHAYLLYRCGIRSTLGNGNLSLTVTANWEPDTITFEIANDASYAIDLSYSVMIEGRTRAYFSV